MNDNMSSSHQPVWYSLASIFISVALVVGFGVAYVARTVNNGVRESERKQCALVIIIDDYFHKAPLPPAVDDSQAKAREEYAAAVRRQRRDFHCDDKEN